MQQRRIRMGRPDLRDFAQIVIDHENRISAYAQLLGDTSEPFGLRLPADAAGGKMLRL